MLTGIRRLDIAPPHLRRRLHNNDQSKNGEMYPYSSAVFWLFTRHCFAWNVGVAFKASTLLFACMHEPKQKKKLFVDRCCLMTLPAFFASIKAEVRSYKKFEIVFAVYTSVLKSPFSRSPLWSPFS